MCGLRLLQQRPVAQRHDVKEYNDDQRKVDCFAHLKFISKIYFILKVNAIYLLNRQNNELLGKQNVNVQIG